MAVFAMIDRFGMGACFIWPLIGLAAGYCVAMFDRRGGPRLLVPTSLGLAGGLAGGVIAGALMHGHQLWEANIAAGVGAAVLALGFYGMRRRRPA